MVDLTKSWIGAGILQDYSNYAEEKFLEQDGRLHSEHQQVKYSSHYEDCIQDAAAGWSDQLEEDSTAGNGGWRHRHANDPKHSSQLVNGYNIKIAAVAFDADFEKGFTIALLLVR
ncbi:hypothetical protein NQ318_005089 [Aromia moschata]|uniref:Uncharacterized protein n=1 Tax=Aromia moschata TaxID=1265417 RepID=A0AAV8YF79_9CUCU|nr:hypothetical protein NQ318_005089 [Aromia moschata]